MNSSSLIKVLSTSQDRAEQLRLILVLLFIISLPYDIFYSSIIFMTLGALTLIDISREKIRRIPRQVWIFQLVYFLGIIGYFYSYNRSAAGFLLERQLNILIMPLILPLAVKIDEQKVEWFLAALIGTSLYAICYLFVALFFKIKIELKLPLIETAMSGNFFNHQFSRPLNIHAGYLSLYVSMSIFQLMRLINRNNSVLAKTLLIICFMILSMGLLFLASRNTIIATIIILSFVYPVFCVRNKARYIIISLICLLIGFLAIRNVPYFKNRFSIELISDIKPLQNGSFLNYNTTEPRVERWKGAIALIERSPVFGYGTGDEIGMLKTEYAKRKLFISYLEEFNAHNQYLSYLIKNGIAGLCIFLFAFYYYSVLAIKRHDFIYFSFLLLLLIGFYTENILDSNKGIIFFAFFNTIFGYNALKKPEDNA
jgi:O-antigen ligase